MKIQNFGELTKIEKMVFRNSEFSQTFQRFFLEKIDFFVPIFFDQKCSDFFRRKIVRPIFFRVPISIPNFPKIPKIILRTACDRSKNTNSTHEEKVSLFFPILTSDPLHTDRISWILCAGLLVKYQGHCGQQCRSDTRMLLATRVVKTRHCF